VKKLVLYLISSLRRTPVQRSGP